MALLASASNVYFRDTQHLVGLFLSAWFFVSPIMYPLSMIESLAGSDSWLNSVYMLNPLSVIVTAYRALQLSSVTFPWTPWAMVGLFWPLLLAGLAFFTFQRSQRYFSDWL
jgi:ABC-2 type transport system permease protein